MAGPKAPVRRSTSWDDGDGYRFIWAPWHPLATADGSVPEHRVVLYRKLGPGSHPCHWCGRLLTWKVDLDTDHLDDVKDRNDPSNLVPPAARCNSARAGGVLCAAAEASEMAADPCTPGALGHLHFVATISGAQAQAAGQVSHHDGGQGAGGPPTVGCRGDADGPGPRFGVSVVTVHCAVQRKTWAWLT